MRILITNDDGYEAMGIRALAAALEPKHEVWIVAPDRNRSAVSCGLTLYAPLCLKQKQSRVYSCSGLPADCVSVAVHGILGGKPIDVVVSGINKGANLGTDTVYSGTVAAARQATLLGIPAVAVSLVSDTDSYEYEPLAHFVSANIEKLVTLCEDNVFVNINAPSVKKFCGCKFTSLCQRQYRDTVELYTAPDSHVYSFFVGGNVTSNGGDDNDAKAVREGFVSLTRLYAEPVNAPCGGFTEMPFVL